MASLPFLPAAPPPWAVRALAHLLLVGFAVVVILSVALELPVTVAGRFTLVPVRGSDPIRAPRAGIVAEVAVVEGVTVEQGGLLFRVRSELAGDRAGEVATLDITLRGLAERLQNQRARHDSQAAADREQRRGLDRQVAALGREIELCARKAALARKVLDHARSVYAERLTSYDEVQTKELEVAKADMDLAHLQTEQDQARSAGEKIHRDMDVRDRELEEAERGLREEAERARVRLSTLKAAPAFAHPGDPEGEAGAGAGAVRTPANELAITAPCAGTVVRLDIRASGAVVAEGEALGQLVCAGEALRAEVSIVDNGMGLVSPGQQVKLYYDAFPYQRHGVRYGTVRWIGPAGGAGRGPGREAAPQGSGPAFRVLVEPRETTFTVRGPAARLGRGSPPGPGSPAVPYPLLPGMTGQAEIIVAEQSAIAYVFEPVRALEENFRRGP